MFSSSKFIQILAALLIFSGCSSSDKIDTSTAEGAFALAEKYEKDERFDEAITYFTEVKNKYPYSKLSVQSELKIADLQFAQENFPEAETAYRLFKEYHPDHQSSDYATFRLGMSVFKQLPDTIDRDLNLASTAIGHFNQVISNYPKSKFVVEASEYKEKAEQMLADKANYIAEFYFIREKWLSALGRYEDLMKNFPNKGYDISALYRATLSAYRLKDMDKAKIYFKRLLAEYPKSKELELARKELADGF